MALTGKREEWQELLRRNDDGIGLKDEHVACIQDALDQTDANTVDVDAALTAMRQIVDRTTTARREGWSVSTRSLTAHTADSDECWWLHRARELGLLSIIPIEPWPRDPKSYIRPPGYLHNYGPEPPAEYVAWVKQQQAELEQRKKETNHDH